MDLFIHRLGLQVGEWDVDRLKKRITVRQLKRWMAYWRVEPFGDEWRRSGRAALVASGGRIEPDSEDKFLPSFREKQQTEAEMLAELKKIPQFKKQLEAQGK